MSLFWNIGQVLSGPKKHQLSKQIIQNHIHSIIDQHRQAVANIRDKQAPEYYKGLEVISSTEYQKLREKAHMITSKEINSWRETA